MQKFSASFNASFILVSVFIYCLISSVIYVTRGTYVLYFHRIFSAKRSIFSFKYSLHVFTFSE